MRGAVTLVCFLVASCVWVVHGATDPGDVSALNALFTDFESDSTLTKWVANGGDPCGDLWFGITCVGTFVTAIQLPNCGLSGKVHGSVLQQFLHVTVLDLSNNKFENDIPEHFPPNLIQLDLSNNKFQGNFPDQLMNIPSLTSIKLNNNKLDGTLNAQSFTTLVNVITLDLSTNKFSGTIPESIGDNMLSLKFLYLQNNKFSGVLPLSLANLVALQVFDVSNNKITGYLPPNFNPATFSYEGNDITLLAPPPPPFTAPPPLKSPNPSTPPNPNTTPNPNTSPNQNAPLASTKSSSSSLGVSKIAAILVVVFVALTAAAILVWFFLIRKVPERATEPLDVEANGHNHSGRFCIWCLPLFSSGKDDEKPAKVKVYEPVFADSMKEGMDSPKIKAQPPIKTLDIPPVYKGDDQKAVEKVDTDKISAIAFTVAELQAATNSFSEENLVGAGSLGQVYRAELPDGRVLAVKKLDTKAASMVENENDFLSVVEGLTKPQHSNVTELLGYCVEHDQRLLVYKYMSRGTLHELLHGSANDKCLSWNMRVKIALGAARALEYLHEVCSPPVVHRNFKSSNILLDDEFIPHVSDCGLEALAPSVTERQVSAQRLGAYSPPEYTMSGTYTAKSDVYSFGVVMLELLTGRKPLDSSRPRSEQSLVRWATPQLHDIDALARMVDPALGGVYPAKSLSRLADVVALCVQPEPEFRPPMSEVVQSLVRLMQRATSGNRQTESKSDSLQGDTAHEPNE
ncbi:hypothetical protein M758_5G185000 [Ceratodon purpureus]|nr:hypothetical protein M758_5G185000 [Ceratodon purpureus]